MVWSRVAILRARHSLALATLYQISTLGSRRGSQGRPPAAVLVTVPPGLKTMKVSNPAMSCGTSSLPRVAWVVVPDYFALVWTLPKQLTPSCSNQVPNDLRFSLKHVT